MLSAVETKRKAAVYAADLVQQEMIIGLGTGTTVYWLILELGQRIRRGLNITAVATSIQSQELAMQLNIPVVDLNSVERLALTIDGADEIDPQLHLIKGGGGALLHEKIVAAASEKLIIIADSSKLVKHLGKFPLPVEVMPFGYKHVMKKIPMIDYCNVVLRQKDDEVFITDSGNYILDCYFDKIDNPGTFNNTLKNIPGVVETGLFINMTHKVIIAHPDERIETIEKS